MPRRHQSITTISLPDRPPLDLLAGVNNDETRSRFFPAGEEVREEDPPSLTLEVAGTELQMRLALSEGGCLQLSGFSISWQKIRWWNPR